jgi:hypothetical protein
MASSPSKRRVGTGFAFLCGVLAMKLSQNVLQAHTKSGLVPNNQSVLTKQDGPSALAQ